MVGRPSCACSKRSALSPSCGCHHHLVVRGALEHLSKECRRGCRHRPWIVSVSNRGVGAWASNSRPLVCDMSTLDIIFCYLLGPSKELVDAVQSGSDGATARLSTTDPMDLAQNQLSLKVHQHDTANAQSLTFNERKKCALVARGRSKAYRRSFR